MEQESLKLTLKESTTRKLASVQKIDEINLHLNSNNLAIAKVLGWQVIIKRDEFQINEKIIYFEIDSLLPAAEWSEFMKERNYRVKTIKLRGEISQGLILPLKILGDNVNPDDYEIGKNLTETIGVEKYEIEEQELAKFVNNQNKSHSPFPLTLIEQTDESRIQSEPKFIQKFQNQPYYASLKYDGTSATYLIDPNKKDEYYICSRNYRRAYSNDDLYSIISDKYQIKEKLLSVDCRYGIQCEIYGPKISKNFLGVREVKMAVFNIKDLIDNRYLDMEELIEVCNKLELPMVDIIEKGDSFNYDMPSLKKLSKGTYPKTNNQREGLVFRLQNGWHNLQRYSFKIINDDFLLKLNDK
jgi:RNA ligase (TIGR02306 family)